MNLENHIQILLPCAVLCHIEAVNQDIFTLLTVIVESRRFSIPSMHAMRRIGLVRDITRSSKSNIGSKTRVSKYIDGNY